MALTLSDLNHCLDQISTACEPRVVELGGGEGGRTRGALAPPHS